MYMELEFRSACNTSSAVRITRFNDPTVSKTTLLRSKTAIFYVMGSRDHDLLATKTIVSSPNDGLIHGFDKQ